MIELTPEMRTAVKRRMGVPDGQEMDPWMGSAIEDVLAIVERDHIVRNKLAPEALQCGHRRHGMDCQLPPAHYGSHGHSTWTAWA